MSIRISEAELLDAIAASVNGGPSDAKTIQELMAEYGMPREKVRAALVQHNRDGRLRVHSVARRAIDGHLRKVPGYTIAPLVVANADQRLKQHRRPSKRPR